MINFKDASVFPGANLINLFCTNILSSETMVVEYYPYHPKVKGSSPAAVADTGREKKGRITAIIVSVDSTVVEPFPNHSKVKGSSLAATIGTRGKE